MDDILQWPGGALGTALRWTIIATLAYLAVLWVALVAWAYRDIRQRTRDPLLHFVSVLLILLFFLPGHWVYLILRPRYSLKEVYDRALEEEALLQELDDQSSCAGCSRRVRDEWLLCPSCGLQLKEPCESCAKPLSYAWVVCPHCGTEKAPRTGTGLRPSRTRPAAGRERAKSKAAEKAKSGEPIIDATTAKPAAPSRSPVQQAFAKPTTPNEQEVSGESSTVSEPTTANDPSSAAPSDS